MFIAGTWIGTRHCWKGLSQPNGDGPERSHDVQIWPQLATGRPPLQGCLLIAFNRMSAKQASLADLVDSEGDEHVEILLSAC